MGTKLVRRQGLIVVAVLLLAASGCDRLTSDRKSPPAPVPVPQVRATVVTIRTTLRPENRELDHRLVIADDRARLGDELDQWRLYDLKAQTVTFVDDILRTRRTETLPSLLRARKSALSAPLQEGIPRPEVVKGTEARQILGVRATSILVRSGTYVREIWIGDLPSIPSDLFRLMVASNLPTSRLAPVMAAIDEALLAAQGFPLVDRTDFTYLDAQTSVDRSVVEVESGSVPASFLEIPEDYKVLAPALTAAKKH